MDNSIELHPWEPFIPNGARILMLGTFPPGQHRWSMNFYYPNRTNDFWRIMGLIFLNDKDALYDPSAGKFDEQAIRRLMTDKHIALHDTARAVRRLKGNASDKYLEIVQPAPIYDILAKMPECRIIAATGEKAAGIIAQLTNTSIPPTGTSVTTADGIEFWRMPSTSRAYPAPLAKKAGYYANLFRHAGIL